MTPPPSRRPPPGSCTTTARADYRVARPAALVATAPALTAVAACAGPSRPGPTPPPGNPGWSLWLFCDTAVTSDKGTRIDRLILGTDTAAAGPYRAGQAPARLSEIPAPPPAAWFPGVAREPAAASVGSGSGGRDQLLISYNHYCVTGDSGSLGTDV